MTKTELTKDDTQVSLAEENRRLLREIRSLRALVDAMQALSGSIVRRGSGTEVVEFLGDVLDHAMRIIDAKDGSLLVYDDETDELVFVVARGDVPQDQLTWRRLPPGEGIAGWVVQNRRATIVNDPREDERFYSGLDEELSFKTRSLLAAPIMGGDRVLGVVEVLNKHDDRLFSVGDQTLLTVLCRFAGEVVHNLLQTSPERPPDATNGTENGPDT